MNKNIHIEQQHKSLFHKKFKRFSLISLFLFSYITFLTFPHSVQRPEILARNRIILRLKEEEENNNNE